MRLAEMLERRFGAVSDKIRGIALDLLPPAIASGNQAQIDAALDELEQRIQDETGARDLEAMAADVAERTNDRHRKAFGKALAVAVGLKVLGDDQTAPDVRGIGGRPPGSPLAAAIGRGRPRGVLVARLSTDPILLAEQFASRNALMVRTLNAQIVPSMRDEIVRAVQFGISPEEAADRLAKKWASKGLPVARGNVDPQIRLIVRDQISKLNASLTRARSEAAGATKFTWQTQEDDRVRPLHESINGNVYTFADGHPTEGLPGDPVLCRCHAIPIIDAETIVGSPGFVLIGEADSAFSL